MEIEMQKEIIKMTMTEGVHSGTIKSIQTKIVTTTDNPPEKLPYFDIVIETEGKEIAYGASQKLTPKSKLYKFVSAFGNIEAGTKFEMNSIIGKKIKFRTINNKAGYVEIVEGSVMPE